MAQPGRALVWGARGRQFKSAYPEISSPVFSVTYVSGRTAFIHLMDATRQSSPLGALKSTKSETVVVLGASDNPERYSYKALVLLREKGHRVIPIHPKLQVIEGIRCFASLQEVQGPIDTLTMYVGPQHQEALVASIIALKPSRVILNPGTEGDTLKAALTKAGIVCVEACTLVLLTTGQF